MKRIFVGFAAVALVLASCGSGSRVSKPEDIGPQVMEILEKMDDMNLQDFKECFMDLNDLHELGKNEDVITEKRSRDFMTGVTKEEWDRDKRRIYQKFKERGAEYYIKWSEIELDNFSYEVETNRGMKGCSGNLVFKFRRNTYLVKTTSLFDGDHYNLMEIRGPYKQK